MDKLDIIVKCLLGFVILLLVILIVAIAIDFDNYQNPKITVLFNDKQQIKSTIIVKVKMRQTYFEEV